MRRLDKSTLVEALRHQHKLLGQHQANLRKLELSAARYGYVPLELSNQIDETQKTIKNIEKDIALLEAVAEAVGLEIPDEAPVTEPADQTSKPQRKHKRIWLIVSGIFTAFVISCSGFLLSIPTTINGTYEDHTSSFESVGSTVCHHVGTIVFRHRIPPDDTIEVAIYSETPRKATITLNEQGSSPLSFDLEPGICYSVTLSPENYTIVVKPEVDSSPDGFNFTLHVEQKYLIRIMKDEFIFREF